MEKRLRGESRRGETSEEAVAEIQAEGRQWQWGWSVQDVRRAGGRSEECEWREV